MPSKPSPGPECLHGLLRRLAGPDRQWHGSQDYLCEQLDMPLRNIQRWTAQLRKENKIVTKRGRGRALIYEIR